MRERAQQDAATQTEEQEVPRAEEQAPKVRFVGGAIPPVEAADSGEKKEVVELKRKVAELVQRGYGGDYKKAFDHYDRDHDGRMTKEEITSMLSDAHVGTFVTRGAWADGILAKLDVNKDSGVSWAEFETVFSAQA